MLVSYKPLGHQHGNLRKCHCELDLCLAYMALSLYNKLLHDRVNDDCILPTLYDSQMM